MTRQIRLTLFSSILFGIIVILYLFISMPAIAQMQFEWVRNYPMVGQDAALDSAGNIYILGRPETNGVRIIKYNPSGSIKWTKVQSSVNGGYLHTASDKYGNLYFTFFDMNDSYFRLTKYDSSGNYQWTKYYVTGGYNTYPQAIALDTTGNIFLIGNSQTATGSPFILKYNAQGDLLWTASSTITQSGFFAGFVDKPGNIYVTGYCRDSNNYSFDYLTIKFNNSGVQQWAKRYNGPGDKYDIAVSVKADDEGYCYVTGYVAIEGHTHTSGTIKYSTSGDTVWTRLYSLDTMDRYDGDYLEIDGDGNVYVTGWGHSLTHFQGEYRTIKYDKYGNLLWIIHDSNGVYPQSMAIDRNNNIFITGHNQAYKFYSVGYNYSGIMIWGLFYPPEYIASYHEGRKVLIDKYNNLYVYGGSLDSAVLLKYSISTGIVNPNQNIVEGYKLYQNYPNPFNSSTIISYSLPTIGYVQINIHNLLGKEVASLVNENKSAGNYEVKFEEHNLSTGVYFYTLFVNGQKMDIKKMMVIK